VDDIALYQKVLKDHLQREFSLKADHTSSGNEAIKKVKEDLTKYKLIFLDYDMPVLNGI